MSEDVKTGERLIECRLCRKPKVFKSIYQRYLNEIDEWSKVCKYCSAIWELGKKTLSATKADGKETESRVYVSVPTDSNMGQAEGSTEVRGKDIMTALGGVSVRGTEIGNPWRDGKRDIISIGGPQDERDTSYIGGGTLAFKVPKARSVAMAKVVAGFQNAIAKARVDGFNEGRSLLSGLADGSVKLDDFSEQTDNARAGKKPKKRWD